jgi:hypothetical protein
VKISPISVGKSPKVGGAESFVQAEVTIANAMILE